jgi:hypothetical protein
VLKSRVLPIVGLLAILTTYFLLSISVRPIADDYCAGSSVTSGIWNYVSEVSKNWGGDYPQIFLNAILVGYPTANWPFFMLGFTTLSLSAALLIIICLKIFAYITPGFTNLQLRKYILLGSMLMLTLWNLYWSLPASLNFGHHYNAFAMSDKSFSGVFGWPTVIVQYLIVPFIIFLGFSIRFQNTLIRVFTLIATSFILGMSGYALALASMLSLIIAQFSNSSRIDFKRFILIELSMFLGFLLSFFSPGSRARADVLFSGDSSTPQISPSRWIFISSIEFFTSMFNVGNLIVLSVISLIIYSFGREMVTFLNLVKLRNLLRMAVIFSFVYYVAISFSEYFTYEAFWHLITYRSVLFLVFTLLGVEIAIWLLNYELKAKSTQCRLFAISFLLVIVSLSILISWQANASLVNRGKIWASHAAPLPGIGDIKPRGSWIDLCWLRLQNARDLPGRY